MFLLLAIGVDGMIFTFQKSDVVSAILLSSGRGCDTVVTGKKKLYFRKIGKKGQHFREYKAGPKELGISRILGLFACLKFSPHMGNFVGYDLKMIT